MQPFPLDLAELFGHWGSYGVFLLIGIAFGAVLEMSGFGQSTKLAAQFYFKDMTVFKVMFTGIIVAMSLVFLTSAVGLLDYNLVWVNPTYLWPGIVGGLVMGVGFIVGGFCPGTSLVSAATLKLDGIMFVAGVFFGIFMFGETVGSYEDFWYSSYLGRYTLPELFDVSTSAMVMFIIVAAVIAFLAAEYVEQIFGDKAQLAYPKWRYAAAGGVVTLALVGLIIGQPDNDRRWSWIEDERETQLANREVQIHPAELLDTMNDRHLITRVIDVRPESDYNTFHILDAEHIPVNELIDHTEEFLDAEANTVFILVSNDEVLATAGWKLMVAESIPNVYLLEGGLNNWITIYADEEFLIEYPPTTEANDGQLAFSFTAALGSRYTAAWPHHDLVEIEYEAKIKIEAKRGATGGGCG